MEKKSKRKLLFLLYTSRLSQCLFPWHSLEICCLESFVCQNSVQCVQGPAAYSFRPTVRSLDNGRNWDTVGSSVMHEKEHTCQRKEDLHTHMSTYSHPHEVEPLSWCKAVLNFKGHLRNSNQNLQSSKDPHTHSHEKVTLLPCPRGASISVPVVLRRFIEKVPEHWSPESKPEV